MQIVLECIPQHRCYCQETVLLHESHKILNFQIADGRRRGDASQLGRRTEESEQFFISGSYIPFLPNIEMNQKHSESKSEVLRRLFLSPVLFILPSLICLLVKCQLTFSDKFTNLKRANKIREMCATPARLSKYELAYTMDITFPPEDTSFIVCNFS